MTTSIPKSAESAKTEHPKHIVRTSHPAGFFSRFEAFVIDLVILFIVQLVGSAFIQMALRFFRLFGIIPSLQDLLQNSTTEYTAGSIVIGLFVIGYFVFSWTLVGFTPGKALMGLKVVTKNGEKSSFFRSLLRFFCYWISAIPIFLGFLWILWDPKRQGWHDKIAGTQVIYTPKKAHK